MTTPNTNKQTQLRHVLRDLLETEVVIRPSRKKDVDCELSFDSHSFYVQFRSTGNIASVVSSLETQKSADQTQNHLLVVPYMAESAIQYCAPARRKLARPVWERTNPSARFVHKVARQQESFSKKTIR